MKKIFIITLIAAILTASICTVAIEPETTVYRGEEWRYDIEEKEYPHITIIPNDRKEPQVYGDGYVGQVEPEKKKYDIVFLGR